jgi:uncharacterized RDD family membrane protein YckC
MKQKLQFVKMGLAIVLGILGLVGALPLRAQDDATEKKDEPVALEQPVDSPVPANESDDEHKHHHWHGGKDVVMVGNDFVLKENEGSEDVVVIAGNATINGRVSGDLVVVGGSAEVLGKVDGELVVVLGSASLGPAAEIGNDVSVIGGTLTREPGAKIGGTPFVLSRLGILPKFEALQSYTTHCLMLGRPIAPQVGWVWGVVGIFLVIYLLIAVLFPRPIQACVDTLEKRPVGSFFMGILLFVLLAPLTFLLAVSIVGIPVIPFLFCAMIVAFLFGKVSVYRFAGTQLGKQFHLETLQLPLVAFLVGAMVFCILYTVPILGFLVWGAIIPFGMGAATLAAFGGLRREGNARSAGAAAAAPASAPAWVPPASDPPLMPGAVSPADFISMPRAGFWLRTCATILDVLLFVFVVIVTGPKALLLWLIYHVAMWAWKGTTVGGIVVGIKLVRVDGRPVDVGVALVRGAASIFSALVLGLGFFWAGWDRGKQSWHDKIAGTVLVQVPRGMPLL